MTRRLESVDFAPGQVIFSRGDLGAELYIIIDGKVKMGCHADDGRENLLIVMAPPDMFGELSILDPGPQPWTATAVTEVRAVIVDRSQLLDWIAEYPAMKGRLLRLLARRLRRTTSTLADLTFIDAPARVAKQLLGLAPAVRRTGERRDAGDARPDAGGTGPARWRNEVDGEQGAVGFQQPRMDSRRRQERADIGLRAAGPPRALMPRRCYGR
jgi:CRP-like cAMP-binding protein